MTHEGTNRSADSPLRGVRVLAALNGQELFGHERGNIEVFKTLRSQGADVIVGTNAQGENHVDAEMKRLGFVTFPLPFSNQWSWLWLKKYPLSVREKISAVVRCSEIFSRAIRQYEPTHIHLGSPLAYSYLSMALTRSQIPLIYRLGDCPPMESRFNLRIWRMAMRRCRKIVANSNYVAARALDAGVEPKKLSVIYGLAPSRDRVGSPSIGDEACRKLDRIVYVGAMAEHKGLLPLVDTFTTLAKEFPALRLDLVGSSRYDTSFRNHLISLLVERGLRDRVAFHGQVDDPSELLRQAALHVAPSLIEEAAANVVLEAKRAGTPSVVFPSGGLPEMVRHRVDGYVCIEKSTAALVEGLSWSLLDKSRLAAMGRAARADFESRFDEARFAAAWTDVYGFG